MNLRAIALGSVIGFLFAVVPSCGKPPCGPANCGGCCDSNNNCVPQSASNSNSNCGTKGSTCANCAAMNQVCNATSFVCEPGGTGGGTGGGTTGGGTTGGGTTGGGTTGGGTTGGGTTGGGSGMACNVMAQNCPNGEICLYADMNGSTAQCFSAAPCNIFTQNCPTMTDKCSYAFLPDGGAGRVCGPAGAKTEGQACAPTDDCGKGLLCVGGLCRKFCTSDATCGGGVNICGSVVSVPNTLEHPATCVMLTACDPLTQNCADMAEGCYLTNGGPACIPAGNVPNGGACGSAGQLCLKGSTCIGPAANMLTCRPFCNLDGGMPTCATGQCGFLVDMSMNRLPWGACQ